MMPDPQLIAEREIEKEIWGIYDLYIHKNARKQVNVGYEVSLNVRYRVHHLSSLSTKVHVFDEAVEQILRLIRSSTLTNFYESVEFMTLAKKREQQQSPEPTPQFPSKKKVNKRK